MKKLLTLMLAIALALSMLSIAVAEEPLTVTVMLPDFYSTEDFQTENNPVLEAIEAATGVKLEINFVANSTYGEAVATTLTDSNMPMLMAVTDARATNIINSARAGAFWDLTDFVADAENYPNLAAGAESIYDNIAIDGRLYGIYRARAYARAGIYYRNDFAAQVGYENEPATVEEFKDMCLKLAALDPNMYVFNMCKYVAGTIGIMTVMCGAPYQYGVDAEGKIYPAFEDAHFQEGLDFMRELYAAGGIDPNFMTIESGNWNDAERSDPVKAIMRLDCLDNGYRYEEWLEENKGTDPAAPVVSLLTALPDAEGKIQIWPQNIGASGEIVVTKAVPEDKLPKIMKFLDWCNTAEGQTLLNCGVENETYWIQSDGFRYTYPEGEAENSATYTAKTNTIQHSLNQLGMNVNGDLTPATAATPLRAEYAQNLLDNAQYVISNPCYTYDSETNNLMGASLAQEVEDAQVQYIAGKLDLAGLQAAYADWHDQGGDMILEEYQAIYDAAK